MFVPLVLGLAAASAQQIEERPIQGGVQEVVAGRVVDLALPGRPPGQNVFGRAVAGPQAVYQLSAVQVPIYTEEALERLSPELREGLRASRVLENFLVGSEFVEAEAGDSLVLLALRHGLEPKTLRLLNGFDADPVLEKEQLVCLRNVHRVLPGETVDQISLWYGVGEALLRELNGLAEPAEPEPFSAFLVPAFADRSFERTGRVDVTQVLPQMGDPSVFLRSTRIERHSVVAGEDFASIAKAAGTTEAALRAHNPEIEEPLPAGASLLVGVATSVPEDASLSLAVVFLERAMRVCLEDLLAVNPGKTVQDLPHGEFWLPPARGPSPVQNWDQAIFLPQQPGVPLLVQALPAGVAIQRAAFAGANPGVVVWDGEVMAAAQPAVPLARLAMPGIGPAPAERALIQLANAVPGMPAAAWVEAGFAAVPAAEPADGPIAPGYQAESVDLPGLRPDHRGLPGRQRLPEGMRGRLEVVEVEEGEDLALFAERVGVPIDRLAQLNARGEQEPLPAGEALIVRQLHRVLPGEDTDFLTALHGDDPVEFRDRNRLAGDAEPLPWSVVEVVTGPLQSSRDELGILRLERLRTHTRIPAELQRPDGVLEEGVELRDLVVWIDDCSPASLEEVLERNAVSSVESLRPGLELRIPGGVEGH